MHQGQREVSGGHSVRAVNAMVLRGNFQSVEAIPSTVQKHDHTPTHVCTDIKTETCAHTRYPYNSIDY